NEFLLYDIHNASEYINIGIKFNLNIKSLFWDSAEEDVIFINADGKFYRINTFQQTKNEIFSHDDVIYVYNNGIYFISGDGSISILNADGDIINTLPDINADDIIFFQYKGKYLPFSTINSDVLYLYDTKQNTFNIINDHLTNLNWSANGEKILFNNNHEIFIYDINTSEKNLVVRTSTEISSVDWLANENYIIYYQNNQIIMTESWNNNANVYKITVDDVFQSISNDNHTKIFLLSNEGLYSLNY
ncbi:hypothetical protein KKF61_00100, partial [Patescibacteria group bacterium]|nr:hypothetical protein [Patescibacteria group bacterium]